MWRRVAGTVVLFSALGVNANQKEYVTGILVNISPSHTATFYQGTSHDEYAYGYAVRVGNRLYVGTCLEKLFSGCDINFVIRAPVQVRFDKSHMFLLRGNGKEQKTNVSREEIINP